MLFMVTSTLRQKTSTNANSNLFVIFIENKYNQFIVCCVFYSIIIFFIYFFIISSEFYSKINLSFLSIHKMCFLKLPWVANLSNFNLKNTKNRIFKSISWSTVNLYILEHISGNFYNSKVLPGFNAKFLMFLFYFF